MPDAEELGAVELADFVVVVGVAAVVVGVEVEAVGVVEVVLDEPQPASASSVMAIAATVDIE